MEPALPYGIAPRPDARPQIPRLRDPEYLLPLALLLSMLFHAALYWIVTHDLTFDFPKPDPVIEVELVQPEPPKPPPSPPQAAPMPPMPAQPPQLQSAPIEKESAAPQPKEAAPEKPKIVQRQAPPRQSPPDAEPAPNAERVPRPQVARPLAAMPKPMTQEEMAAAVKNAPKMAQSEQDFFLSQIVQNWVIDRHAPQFQRVTIFGAYVVLPNGMLAAPFGKDDPWDMRRMVQDWDKIPADPRYDGLRTAMETFLRAMRLAQPLQLPPGAKDYPKVMTLNFKVPDIP